jgi:putative transposase
MHHRRSIRLKHYDYQNTGVYYVTICTKYRSRILGRVKNGKIARDEWIKTAQLRDYILIDEFVIMPDHMHGVLIISRADDVDFGTQKIRRGMMHHAQTNIPAPNQNMLKSPHHPPTNTPVPFKPKSKTPYHVPTNNADQYNQQTPTKRQFAKPIKNSLPTIVSAYKASVTRKINCLRNTPGGIIWQRNYYEHFVRNENVLLIIRKYIFNNPGKYI